MINLRKKEEQCFLYLSNEMNEEELISFEISLLTDDKLRVIFEEYKEIWEAYPSSKVIIDKSKYRALNYSKKRKKRIKNLSVMFAVSLFLIFAFMVTFRNSLNNEMVSVVGINGELKQIEMPDGSIVILRNDATISYYNSFMSDRQVWLKGEAFFDIKKQDGLKFTVNYNDLEVEVLGTTFSISNEGKIRKISLLTGSILTKFPNGEELFLKPNEQIKWDSKNSIIVRESIDVSQELFWRKDILILNDETLEQAINKINSFYDVYFTVVDKELLQKTITGTFQKKSLSEFIYSLEFILNATIVKDNNNFLIQSK